MIVYNTIVFVMVSWHHTSLATDVMMQELALKQFDMHTDGYMLIRINSICAVKHHMMMIP